MMNIDDNLSDPIAQMEQVLLIRALMAELKSGLLLYWEAAGQILRQRGVALKTPTDATFSLQKNFFSLLFLYSYQRAGIPRSRRILYAATIQCLRGMVTGCDNLLDDEYKQTMDTDIPATGYRFRSVMDIMVSDRALFQILMDAAIRQEIASDRVLAAAKLSLFQRRHLGFVFQRGNLLSYLTVAENIGLPLTLNGIVGTARAKRIEALLADIDLRFAATALPHELSGGETQRVSVARAIAHHPKLLLADEPTANLDTATGQRVVRLMRDLGKNHGCTIIMATHDRDITDTADPFIGLKDGQVVREGE